MLTGPAAIRLYLQCYQLILWKQAYWLVHVKGYPEALEVRVLARDRHASLTTIQEILRDLWTLRIQSLPEIDKLDEETHASQVFSTQSEDEVAETGRSSNFLQTQKLPHIVESLSLCYLSLVLLHQPVCFGEVYKWLPVEDFVFVNAYEKLPRTMTRSLPPSHRAALQVRVSCAQKHCTVSHQTWDSLADLGRSECPSLAGYNVFRWSSFEYSSKSTACRWRRLTTICSYSIGCKSSRCRVSKMRSAWKADR